MTDPVTPEERAREFWIDHSRDLWTLGRYKDERGEAVTRTMDERIASLAALLRSERSRAAAIARKGIDVWVDYSPDPDYNRPANARTWATMRDIARQIEKEE